MKKLENLKTIKDVGNKIQQEKYENDIVVDYNFEYEKGVPVSIIHFHIKEKEQIISSGYFSDNKININNFAVDKVKLYSEIEKTCKKIAGV